MISSAEKTKRETFSAGLAIFGFASKSIHINTSGNIQLSASTSVCSSSTYLAVSSFASSSPPLLRDGVALALAPLNIPSALIQTQTEIGTIDVLSSNESSAVKTLAKSIQNDITASDNEPPT